MTNSTALKLYGEAENDLSLKVALAKTKASGLLKGAMGLFYSPRSCVVGRVTADGEVETLQKIKSKWVSRPLDSDSVFEAKLFNEAAEFSWLNEPTSIGGRAVLVTEKAIETSMFERPMELAACDAISQSYLVWGQYDTATDQAPEGWTIVSTSQIGQLAVPLESSPPRDFVTLKAKEYLTTDEHGNAYVKYERLLGLSWVSKENKKHG